MLGPSSQWKKQVLYDAVTGREVWQMTDGPSINHVPYTYSRAFSSDENHLVLSSNRTGRYQVYRVHLNTGEAVQLSDYPDYDHMSLNVDPQGREVYLTAGPKIMAIDILTGEERVVIDCSSLSGGNPITSRAGLNGSGSKALVTYYRPDGRMALAVGGTESGSTPVEAFVFTKFERISHPLFCPADDDLVSFVPLPDTQNNMDLKQEERARVWSLRLSTGEIQPLIMAPKGFRATHESWSPDGSRLYFHLKHVPKWSPASIASIPAHGGEMTVHFTSQTIKLGHSSVNRDHTMIVSDSQAPGHNELVLIDIASGDHKILCYPNASGAPHPNHVHPNFSPSGNYIIYTSDVSGSAQVYVIPLREKEGYL